MLETLDYTIRIGSTPTIFYFDFYLYSAYAAHYVYYKLKINCLLSKLNRKLRKMFLSPYGRKSNLQPSDLWRDALTIELPEFAIKLE